MFAYKNSISATQMGDFGKCRAMVKVRHGSPTPRETRRVHWGNRKHKEFESNVERYMKKSR